MKQTTENAVTLKTADRVSGFDIDGTEYEIAANGITYYCYKRQGLAGAPDNQRVSCYKADFEITRKMVLNKMGYFL